MSLDRYYKYCDNRKLVGTFGIKYLDDRMKGIRKGDLILIGARSGAGKSTLAEMIAIHNAKQGKNICLFSLENFEDDGWGNRLYYRYKELSCDYKLDINDFIDCEYDIKEEILEQSILDVNELYSKVNIISRGRWDVDSIGKEMLKCIDRGCEMIILDHLDYVDKDNPNENDNTHITALMSKIREIQDETKTPIIAISHLRKSMNPRFAPAIPSMDEFHGSSNKVKEATAVIMFAPDDTKNVNEFNPGQKATWCCIRKYRLKGIDNKACRLWFSTKTGKYDENYEECTVNYAGTEIFDMFGNKIEGEKK